MLFARFLLSRASSISFNWVLITIPVSSAPFSPWERSVQVVRTGTLVGQDSLPKAGVGRATRNVDFLDL